MRDDITIWPPIREVVTSSGLAWPSRDGTLEPYIARKHPPRHLAKLRNDAGGFGKPARRGQALNPEKFTNQPPKAEDEQKKLAPVPGHCRLSSHRCTSPCNQKLDDSRRWMGDHDEVTQSSKCPLSLSTSDRPRTGSLKSVGRSNFRLPPLRGSVVVLHQPSLFPFRATPAS